MPALTRVPRGSLTDQVIDQLRERIVGGQFPVDQRLPVEASLARELGVGRSTVREALRVLVHAGLLESRQGDGTYVRARHETDAALRRRVLKADVINAYEVRRAMEVEAARLAATHRSAADLARLHELAAARDDAAGPESYRRADRALREHVVECTGNPLLGDLYRGVVDPLRSAAAGLVDEVDLVRDDPARPETADLVRAIADQDPRAAADAAARHMDAVLRVLTVMLQAAPIRRHS
ncbi:hypothetical protein PSU4_16700 [Pseudonocardia sulfidoxydans NBRC 16205]|uniref:HTH gntR-type domain-containing protein n=1 Tax=Pseudonocardia sulfidoxydans NBRC 16205 TaxID=1223511 RepID=A0A511DD34_9PSEU|nr:hypothetical protein PSU4_16700 [Pseudonocardia sulfidoxydans NBRC 16205]